MKYVNLFNTTQELNDALMWQKNLPYYLNYNKEEGKLNLKPLQYINFICENECQYKIKTNANKTEIINLNKGENKIFNAVYGIEGMYGASSTIISSGPTIIDLSNCDNSLITDASYMFAKTYWTKEINMGRFDPDQLQYFDDMFWGADSLQKITCTQKFQNWCIQNKETINLPSAYHNIDNPIWNIIA